MNAPMAWNGNDTQERSAVYRALASAFAYPGAGTNTFGISGAEYNDAFDPAVNPNAASLREGAHIEDEQSALFEELVRFYEFFGLGRGEAAEMPDHITVELEFMHFLTHLEAQAADHSRDIDSIRRAQRDFLSRHLLRLLRGLQAGINPRRQACATLVTQCVDFVAAELEQLQDN